MLPYGVALRLPYVTADLPGTGGTLRTVDDDFRVDEVPAYPPAGTGDHVFAKIEKRGATTPFAVATLARALGVRDRDIGVAGMKDRHAVTTQWISLPPPVTPEKVLAATFPEGTAIRVLEAVRHPHKLRTGHLHGNRFRIRIRGVEHGAAARASEILARLAEAPGAPNWFGEQRFGRDGDNAARGRALVTGDIRPGRDRKLDRLLVSALQSELFNAWLIARLADDLYRTALAGDLFHKRGGGMFACDDPATDGPRIARGEIVPTGPMFGAEMRAPPPDSPAGRRERAILDAAELAPEAFASVRAIAQGTRRDAAIAVTEVAVGATTDDQPGETLEVAFALPAGAYATAVLREVLKHSETASQSAEPT